MCHSDFSKKKNLFAKNCSVLIFSPFLIYNFCAFVCCSKILVLVRKYLSKKEIFKNLRFAAKTFSLHVSCSFDNSAKQVTYKSAQTVAQTPERSCGDVYCSRKHVYPEKYFLDIWNASPTTVPKKLC